MNKKITILLLFSAVVLLFVDIASRLLVQPVQAGEPSYKIVATPGRGASVTQYEDLLNDMASKGWEFEGWLYSGSAQTPDLIFKK